VNTVLRIVSRCSLEKGELNTINNSLTECMRDFFDLMTQQLTNQQNQQTPLWLSGKA